MRIRTVMLLLMTLAWLSNACDENAPFDASKIPLGTPQNGAIADGTPSVGTPTGPDGGGGPPPPPAKDADQDGVPDAIDNCPQHANTNQLNIAHPTLGDRCNPAIVWVSTTGLDTNDGTYEHPTLTIQHAADLATQNGKSGHIFLRSGTYSGIVTLTGGITLVGGFGEEQGQLVHDPATQISLLTHTQKAPVITVSGDVIASPSVLQDLQIQHDNAEEAGGIAIEDLSTTIKNVQITVNGLKHAYGVAVNLKQPSQRTIELEKMTVQVNANSAAAATGRVGGVIFMNWNANQAHTVRVVDSTIDLGPAALAIGLGFLENKPLSEFWIRHNTIHIAESNTAVGIALGWEASLAPQLLPFTAVAGDLAAVHQNQVSVAAKNNAIGMFIRGASDAKIANNAVKAAALVDTTNTIGLVANAIADDAMFFANTIRVYGGDTATALHLNGIAGKTALINNLLDLQKGIVDLTAFSVEDVASIVKMTHNLVTAKGPITYYAQWGTSELDASSPAHLESKISGGLTPIQMFIATDNPLVQSANFLNTTQPNVAPDSPAKDTGFDMTTLPGADPKAAGFQELAVDVFGAARPQGKGWDIGAFEQ